MSATTRKPIEVGDRNGSVEVVEIFTANRHGVPTRMLIVRCDCGARYDILATSLKKVTRCKRCANNALREGRNRVHFGAVRTHFNVKRKGE